MVLEITNSKTLRAIGKFYCYILPGHYEVWRVGKTLYTIVDGVKNGKVWDYIERFKPKDNQPLYAGFHPHDGMPCLKD